MNDTEKYRNQKDQQINLKWLQQVVLIVIQCILSLLPAPTLIYREHSSVSSYTYLILGAPKYSCTIQISYLLWHEPKIKMSNGRSCSRLHVRSSYFVQMSNLRDMTV